MSEDGFVHVNNPKGAVGQPGIPVRLAQETIDALLERLGEVIAADSGFSPPGRTVLWMEVEKVLADACHVLRPEAGDLVVFQSEKPLRQQETAYISEAIRELLRKAGHGPEVQIAVVNADAQMIVEHFGVSPLERLYGEWNFELAKIPIGVKVPEELVGGLAELRQSSEEPPTPAATWRDRPPLL